jgi:hypothetical protein
VAFTVAWVVLHDGLSAISHRLSIRGKGKLSLPRPDPVIFLFFQQQFYSALGPPHPANGGISEKMAHYYSTCGRDHAEKQHHAAGVVLFSLLLIGQFLV